MTYEGDKLPGAGREGDPVAAAMAGELALLRPEVRRSHERIAALLDPEFTEVGASGRHYDRAAMLDALPRMPKLPGRAAERPATGGTDGAPPEAEAENGDGPRGMTGVELAPGLVHLTYETVHAGRRARRSSLWRRRPGSADWRMYYHQGTPVPED